MSNVGDYHVSDSMRLGYRGYKYASRAATAINAYKFGRSLINSFTKRYQMAPVDKRTNPYVTPNTPRRMRRRTSSIGSSTVSAMSHLMRTSPYLRSVPRRKRVVRFGDDVRVVKKPKSSKKKKIVKVSRKLRAKIKKVISAKEIKGNTMEIYHGVQRLIKTEDNKQIVADITVGNSLTTNPHFSMAKIMDAASVLWNEKTQTDVPKAITDVNNFAANKLKVKVVNSNVTYHLRNNTQRTLYIKLLDISPVSAQVIGEPFQAWIQGMAFQATGIANGPNQNNTAVTQLYTNPNQYPEFRKLFKTETTTIEIQPGGTYKHYIQGPKDKMFDFQRAWNGSVFQNYHKEAKWTLITYHCDLVSTTLGGVGRYFGDVDATILQSGLLWEAVVRYTLEMPEQTGTIASTVNVGDPVPMTQRQYSFAYKTYPIGIAGDIIRIDDDQPATIETNP